MVEYVQRLQCPYCQTQAVLFSGNSRMKTKAGVFVVLTCGYCEEPVISRLNPACDEYLMFETWNGPYDLNDDSSPVFSLGTIPELAAIVAPADCPPRIAKAFEQAVFNLRQGHYETCVILCGRALDLATKGMDETWKLERRLAKLASENRITPAMAEWATEIRLDRNVAAHEEHDFTKESVEEILGFTEAFLNYLYTLPALIASRRAVREVEDLIS